MRDTDTGAFVASLSDVYALYPSARPLSEGQVAMFMRAVRDYAIEQVRAAFDAHVRDPQRGRFPPMPADVIAQIEGLASDDNRPGAEEAWAIAVRARDEAATVVWTEEIAQAWGVAREVLDLGDEVGARVAFRDAYTRLVAEARKAGRRCAWQASLGHDAEQREAALAQAVALGRIGAQPQLGFDGKQLLEGPKRGGDPMRKLLAEAPPDIRDRLQRLRDEAAARAERLSSASDRSNLDDRRRTQELQQGSAEQVRRYSAQQGVTL